MAKKSAGILLYRFRNSFLEVLLVHPGGPFWAKKDLGVWSIPKGEFTEGEEKALDAALREFKEETGTEVNGTFAPLLPLQQKSGKIIYAWALEGDLDAASIKSNYIEIDWPPHSNSKMQIPEVDKAEWFKIKEAKEKIVAGQVWFIIELVEKLHYTV